MSISSKAIKRWEEHCEKIRQFTGEVINENDVQKTARIKRARRNYRYFVNYYFPHYCKDEKGRIIPPAKFHIKAANKILKSSKLKALLEWSRFHAKSTTSDIFIPIWLMIQERTEINCGVIISKSQDAAKRLLGDLQAELENNQRLINDFGEFKNTGSWEDGEFETKQGVLFVALGRGQSPRGLKNKAHRPDFVVIDDLDDDEIVQNPDRVTKMVNWVLEAVFPMVNPKRYRFLVVGNRIHKNSLISRIAKKKSVWHSKVNALDKTGKPTWPEHFTKLDIQEMIDFMGYFSSQKELFNNPIQEGKRFKAEWIKYQKLPKLHTYDKLVLYLDPSYSETGCFKAAKLWGRHGRELHLIKSFVRQCSIEECVKWVYDLSETIPENAVVSYYVEGKFIQDRFVNDFDLEGDERGYYVPIIADERSKPDKFVRIDRTTAFYSRGNVIYNIDEKEDPDMKRAEEHLLAFEKGSGAPTDSPDADEGAIWYLMKNKSANSHKPLIGMREHKSTW